MTRAKDHLHLIVPQRFYAHSKTRGGDRHVYAARTRFITAAILHRFENCAWPSADAKPSGRSATGETVDIGMRLRRMWT